MRFFTAPSGTARFGLLVIPLLAATLLAACACTRREPPRHVIVILLDAARADRFSYYGYARQTTPHLDALGTRGVVFLNHFTQGVDTRSALPTLLYSRYYSRPLFPWSDVVPYSHPSELFLGRDPQTISLPRALASDGFHTAMISAHAWLQPQTAFAREFDEVHPVGEIEKVTRARGDGESEHRYFYHRAEQMVRYAGDWIEQNKEKDFFLYLHLMDSHTPHFLDEDARRFLSDAELAEVDVGRFRQDGHGPKDAGPPLSPAERRYLDALYDGSLLYLDRHLGRMFERLRRLGTLDHTLIAVTSDHGENLAEVSGRFGHAGTWNDIVARIPLILFYPPGLDAKRVSALTEGVDLLPTILGLLDVSLPDSKRADGRDLAAALESDAIGGGQAFMRNAIRTDRIKCVFRSEEEVLDPEEAPPVEAVSAELYDLATDPLETRNIWAERPREAEKCLQLFRSRMLPLHRRYRATMTGEQPEAPFAIAATYIQTGSPLPRLERDDVDDMATTVRGRWGRFEDWRNFFLLGGVGAPPLTVEFQLPNGRYGLTAGILGAGTLRMVGTEKTLQLRGSALEEGMVEGSEVSHLDWQRVPVDLGTIDVTDGTFRAEIQPAGGGSSLLLRQFGFTPIKAGGPRPEPDDELLERLRGLGYVE